ncbi:protein of unknown function DUF6 transmembrane [Rhizobium sp. PDO1-076]|uniref:hypothetical protein n=1 Tax=Rhizobium sp. PDO1-076 TaxID=1125979 RepID=UPI00024E29CE|nr:hypothetical protein [Rhizobium sp. PDO1-076]EHS49938.1 protein of unknown function DUF6 transmembrane [Rhizobium sp. PDO1-076]
MNPVFLIWLGAAMATFLAAATVSRAYVSNNNLWVLAASLALYCLGNLMMVKLMREGGLGMAISASAIAQLVLINVIAFFLFGERLSAIQMAGVALGVVSMALMLYPAKGGV